MYFIPRGVVASALEEILPYPTYSSSRFAFGQEPSLIFDDGKEGGTWSDSDRFRLWDSKACARAEARVKNMPHKRVTALWWQMWLEGYHNAPVQLHKISAYTNMGGYGIWCLNYDVVEKQEPLDKNIKQKFAEEVHGKHFEDKTNEK